MGDVGMMGVAAQAMTGSSTLGAVLPPDCNELELPVSSSQQGLMQHRDWRYEDEVHALRAQAIALESQVESCKTQVESMTTMLKALDEQVHVLRWRLTQAEAETKVRQSLESEADSKDGKSGKAAPPTAGEEDPGQA